MPHVELDNAREKEQKIRMVEHLKNKRCHFCPEGFKSHGSPVIKKGKNWFITANDFPYKGSIHHYLIVLKRHCTRRTLLKNEESVELIKMEKWLAKKLKVSGYSFFCRSGNMKITGATLDHLHCHFVVGVKKRSKNHEMIFGPLGYKKKSL